MEIVISHITLSKPSLTASYSPIIHFSPQPGILVTSSKGTSFIASLLNENGKNGVRLIGYDLLKENIIYLQSGIIDFLINQNPKRQAFLGINYLANFLLLKKEPPVEDLFPLEVITRQNSKSYLASKIH